MNTLDEIAQLVGYNLNYYDGSSWTSGGDVTEAQIKTHINYLYRDELFVDIQQDYPYYYRHVELVDSWIANSTVDATSSGTTLVAAGSIFDDYMQDPNFPIVIYNETQDLTTKIDTFTNPTTVETTSSIDAWNSGDSIFILGRQFILPSSLDDMYAIESVEVRFKSSDKYIVAKERELTDYRISGYERGVKGYPEYYETTLEDSNDKPKAAIAFTTNFDSKLADAIRITFIQRPPELTDSDKPKLPQIKPLVSGTTAWAFRKRQLYDQASVWEQKFQLDMRKLMNKFTPDFNMQENRPRVARRYVDIFNKRR